MYFWVQAPWKFIGPLKLTEGNKGPKEIRKLFGTVQHLLQTVWNSCDEGLGLLARNVYESPDL